MCPSQSIRGGGIFSGKEEEISFLKGGKSCSLETGFVMLTVISPFSLLVLGSGRGEKLGGAIFYLRFWKNLRLPCRCCLGRVFRKKVALEFRDGTRVVQKGGKSEVWFFSKQGVLSERERVLAARSRGNAWCEVSFIEKLPSFCFFSRISDRPSLYECVEVSKNTCPSACVCAPPGSTPP